MAVIPIKVIGRTARPGPYGPLPRPSGGKPAEPAKDPKPTEAHGEPSPEHRAPPDDGMEQPASSVRSAAAEQPEDGGQHPDDDPSIELRGAYERLLADFRNYKRHAEHDLAEAEASGRDELVRALIPVLSDLEAASRPNGGDAETVRRGVRMIRLKLDDILARAGYDRIDTSRGRMDPRVHEAIAVVPAKGAENGRILEELSPGYTRNGQLVQPARVTVAKGDAAHSETSNGSASGHGNRRDDRMAGAVFEADGG